MYKLLLLGLIAGCAPVPQAGDGPASSDLLGAADLPLPLVDAGADAGADAALACDTTKIDFTQAQGCQNDGSVEFCLLPTDGGSYQVRLIDPSITCAPGGGRARCDPKVELLCFMPTAGPASCVAPHGAMTDAAWAKVCRLAALSEVRRIVPTWFE